LSQVWEKLCPPAHNFLVSKLVNMLSTLQHTNVVAICDSTDDNKADDNGVNSVEMNDMPSHISIMF